MQALSLKCFCQYKVWGLKNCHPPCCMGRAQLGHGEGEGLFLKMTILLGSSSY